MDLISNGWPMKRIATLFLSFISMLVPVCAQSRALKLDDLRLRVERSIPKEWTCSPVKKGSNGAAYFDVSRGGGSLCNISVQATEALTQKEWNARRALKDEAVKLMVTPSGVSKANAMEVAKHLSIQLPDGTFAGIGIRVDFPVPDVSDPNNERDGREADGIVEVILNMLRRYQRANKTRQHDAGASPVSRPRQWPGEAALDRLG